MAEKAERQRKEGKKVSDAKVKAVKSLAENMNSSKSVMILSIKNLPSPQLQKIKKGFRGRADILVVKKSIMLRAIDEAKIPEMTSLKEHVQSDCAVALSKEDAFELAGSLTESKSPVSAKEGQIAEEDIKVEAGPTELMPGPAISELGAVGLKVSVEDGKITIREPKVIVKKGEKVSTGAAAVLQKLDIKPFSVGINVAVIYDSSAKKVYAGIKIDKKKAVEDLMINYSKAMGLAQKINYYCREIIGYLLAKANAEANALTKLGGQEK